MKLGSTSKANPLPARKGFHCWPRLRSRLPTWPRLRFGPASCSHPGFRDLHPFLPAPSTLLDLPLESSPALYRPTPGPAPEVTGAGAGLENHRDALACERICAGGSLQGGTRRDGHAKPLPAVRSVGGSQTRSGWVSESRQVDPTLQMSCRVPGF
ncbi:uncharacterized protein LOC121136231 isoform X5 [Mesocricetus auratus]|uniref:Uncharacterized protein LOC121136231 isoform X5 n=1 Tax=Mesocricetus auratus TaxID=10036 RepID=A0ABM2WV90_MESAU|nr:uncharacterized protein LOC121136231 isoform X5 [Mesocricetus auratus]